MDQNEQTKRLKELHSKCDVVLQIRRAQTKDIIIQKANKKTQNLHSPAQKKTGEVLDNDMKTELEIAEDIARNAHAGQTRRDGVTPYITHPEKVAELCHGHLNKSVAWLHDVIEDTELTMEDLVRMGVRPRVAMAVSALTKTKGCSYQDYLEQVASDNLARKVKVYDMIANLMDDPTEKQVVKYKKGLNYLLG